MSEDSGLLSPQEAAVFLGVDLRTIREWIRNGVLKSVMGAGNRRMVLRSSIIALQPNARALGKRQLSLNGRFVYGLKVPDGFDLITTYNELAEYSRAFAKGDMTFLLLVGSPGSGKSRQLKSDLAKRKHKWIDNHVTNMGLYCSVYEAKNTPIVLDDVNHFFKSTTACSLMKALTQTDQVRSVSWESTTTSLDKRSVPRQFVTASRICLIGNTWDSDDPNMLAVQDRSMRVAFCPSAETIHKRVKQLGWCDPAVWQFIGDHLAKVPQPSMREYYHGMTYRKAGMKWQDKLKKLWGLS